MDQGFEDTDHALERIGRDVCEQTGKLLAQLIRTAFGGKGEQLVQLHP
jgi:hypothetical protein